MDMTFDFLTSDASQRQLLSSASSGGLHGLGMGDILRSGLAGYIPANKNTETHCQSPDERAFQALVDAKVWTSKVAMRLDLKARDRYFEQLNRLHETEEWFQDQRPLNLDSYRAFVRFMLAAGGETKPSLALSSNGNLLAVWQCEGNRLTLEFGCNHDVEWSVMRQIGEMAYPAAGRTPADRLVLDLVPYFSEFELG